jgi:putative Holliday junction resolvase
MRVLGIDLGTKTMGIAISDPLRIIVNGLNNFHHNENYDLCVEKIIDTIFKYNDVDTILIGNPIKMDGTSSKMSNNVNNLKMKLENRKLEKIKIVLFDERYSTKIALNELKNRFGNNYQKIKEHKDEMSAIIIVREYINS